MVKTGIYTAPRQLDISGIPTTVVDPHNEVFPAWVGYRIGQKQPAILLRVDNHLDMASGAWTFEHFQKKSDTNDIDIYAKCGMRISEFTIPAVHYGIFGAVYCFDPREDGVVSFGSFSNGHFVNTPKAVIDGNVLRWEGGGLFNPIGRYLSIKQLITELKGYSGPLVLDNDLDGYACVDDEDLDQHEELSARLLWENRFDNTMNLLEQLPTPGLITIARSQTPQIWTSPGLIDFLEEKTISTLRKLYKK
ncbi:MAG: UPF0489 family protein [Candidatus Woesearchaeota archaeon]